MMYKKLFLFPTAILCTLTTFSGQTNPNLEFASVNGDGNPTGNGPVTNTVINFIKNTNNPSGNTFTTYAPTLSATYSLSNQAYANAARFGWTTTAGAPIFQLMNSAGAPSNSNFTSSGASTGSGLNIANNRGVNLTVNANTLSGQSTNGTYAMTNLTITFNRPVNNPILHIAGLGAFQGSLGFTGGFEYVSSNVPITFSKLSGNSSVFNVTSTSIKNTATNPTATGNNSASGSVLVSGHGITTITLKVNLRGDGNGSWAGGEGITIGISALESDLTINKTINNSNPNSGSDVIFTLTAQNKGASNNTNVTVNDLLPNGYTFINATPSIGSYNSSSGVWNIGTFNDGASATLSITAHVNNTGNYTNTASISGDLSDPNTSDNSSSVTPNVSSVCYNNPNTSTAGINTIFGITSLQRAGGNNGWPMIRKSAYMALESNTKGMVINRLAKADLGNITIPVEGMMVYDTTDKCLKIYSDGTWNCFSTPTCP